MYIVFCIDEDETKYYTILNTKEEVAERVNDYLHWGYTEIWGYYFSVDDAPFMYSVESCDFNISEGVFIFDSIGMYELVNAPWWNEKD